MAPPAGLEPAAFCLEAADRREAGLVMTSLHGGEIGEMERQFCWEVLYNLNVLYVGA